MIKVPEWWFPKKRICGFLSPDSRDTGTGLFNALMLADRLGHEKVSTTLNTYSHLFPHKQQELVHSLESLQTTDSPTPEPPSDNPLLEAAGITCEVSQTQDNGSDVTIRSQFGPALVPPNTASGKIIQMPQRKII